MTNQFSFRKFNKLERKINNIFTLYLAIFRTNVKIFVKLRKADENNNKRAKSTLCLCSHVNEPLVIINWRCNYKSLLIHTDDMVNLRLVHVKEIHYDW